MAVDSKHPLYNDMLDRWIQCRDTHEGEQQVKEKGITYLFPTSGMAADGMLSDRAPGYKAYQAYKGRAVVPDLMKEAVEAMIGVMHHKPPVIELPEVMEPLREVATLRNESLEMLLRRINEEQLVTGRCGLLADLPQTPSPTNTAVQAAATTTTLSDLPYIALYEAEDIINWDEGRRDGIEVENLNFVALDESEFERDAEFEWEEKKKYRILILGEVDENEPQGLGTYRVGVFRENDITFNETDLIEPSFRGQTLNAIPFTFINSCDVVPTPDVPPLLGISNLVLTIYRGEADYRQNLFMQGQDTLITIGLGDTEDSLRVGAGGRIDIPTGGDAKYIGVSNAGISEQRSALENDYNRASAKGGQLLDTTSRQKESGDALTIRVAARTATLNRLALTGAFGLEHALKKIAVWIGADPNQVVVTPNLDFVDDAFVPDDLVKLMSAKNLGAPISVETIHRWLQDQDMTDLEFEEEIAKIEEEQLLGIGTTAPEEDQEDDPDEDPDEDA